MPDIRFENHGSIWLLRGLTDQGKAWLDQHVCFETFFGGAGVVEPRYVQDIVTGANNDGLDVELRQ